MKMLRALIVLLLLLFIAIGDGVIFVGKTLFSLADKLIKNIHTTFNATKKTTVRTLKKTSSVFPSSLPVFSLPQLFRLPKRQVKSKEKHLPELPLKRHKKNSPIVIFPFPFLSKFKYFTMGIIFSFFFIFTPLLFLLFIQDLPSPKTLVLGQIPQTTKIYDRHHTLLYQLYADQNRTVIPLTDVPKHLQNASIATEDKDFYKHPGFDVTAIIRSLITNLSGGELQGGSTITQQLIKSALLTPETSITRKVKEIVLAFWAERMFSKTQILEMYFNQVPYGGTAWGVEAAAQTYFGKRAKDLDLAESAFLAGIPRAPSIYSPFGNTPTLWKKRQTEVLARMGELGYISQQDREQAVKQELFFKRPHTPLHAPHFVMYVRDLLIKKYGLPFVERGGLTVVTSIDLSLQEKVQTIVAEEVGKNAYLNLTNGAAMVTNPKNGDILAMIGSKSFEDEGSGNVNVTTSLRQPGSSIKVVTYAAALSKGYTAATILDDSAVVYTNPGAPSYAPVNYDGKFHGRVPLRLALANSFNIPAVKILNHVGIPTVVELGKKMGITTWTSPERYGLSLTLGGAETTMIDMTTVYGVLANDGLRVDANPIVKITDGKGNVLEEKQEVAKQQVLDTGVAFILSSILSDNNARSQAFGPNSVLNIPGKIVSVKTGTSDNKRDNWTIGYTNDRVVAVWVGNNNGAPMSQTLASGITGAAPIWNRIITVLLEGKPGQILIQPTNVVTKSCLGRTEFFVKGTENSVSCIFRPSPSVSPSPGTNR